MCMVGVGVGSANRSPRHSFKRFYILATPYAVWMLVMMKHGVGLALGPFQVVDHSAPGAPAVPGAIGEVGEDASGLVRPLRLCARHEHLGRELGVQAAVGCEAVHVFDVVFPPPRHQLVAEKPLSARSTMETEGQRSRIWATMRVTSLTLP